MRPLFLGWILWYRILRFYAATQWKSQENNRSIDMYLSISKIPVLIFICISSLYGIRLLIISTCDPEIGVAFWILIPSISLLWGLALGSLIGRYTESPILMTLSVLFLELIWVLFRLAFEPPIQVYEWFLVGLQDLFMMKRSIYLHH